MKRKRLMFWGAVAGVAILANFAVEAIAPHAPAGFRRFVAKTHHGAA